MRSRGAARAGSSEAPTAVVARDARNTVIPPRSLRERRAIAYEEFGWPWSLLSPSAAQWTSFLRMPGLTIPCELPVHVRSHA